jgi:CHAT domain-containing protein
MKKLLLCFLLGLGARLMINSQAPADSARQLYSAYREAWARGDFDRSRSLLEHIIAERYPLPDYNLALVRNSLGLVYYEMGLIEDALEQYRIADTLATRKDPGSIKLKINIYNNLSLLYDWLGDYSSALSHYDRAIRLLDSLPDRDEDYFRNLSRLKFNKGFVFYRLGQLDEALELISQSERIKETHGLPYLGSVYSSLARIYQELGRPVMAEHYFRKSIDRWIAESGDNYYQLGNVYLYFGLFLAHKGDRDQAMQYFTLALHNYISNYGVKHPVTAACYERLANFFLEERDFPQALEMVQLGLISVSEGFSDKEIYSNPETGQSLHDLTLLKCFATKTRALEGLAGETEHDSLKIKILDAALAANARAIEVLYLLQGSYLSSESRTYLTSGQKELFSTGIRLNLEQYEHTHDLKHKEEAFILAARGKSNELVFEMREKEWLYLESLPGTLASEVLELKQQTERYSNLIQTEILEVDPDSSRMADWQEKLFSARAAFSRDMEQLKGEHPQIGQFESSGAGFSLDWIRRNLDRNETLVEYYLSGENAPGIRRLFAFVITRKDFHIFQRDVDGSFNMNIENVMENLHEFNPFTVSPEAFDSLKKSLFGIYQQIFEPAEPFIKGRDLIIAPDEELAYLPFDALINRYEKEVILNYAGLPYLLNEYNIVYVYNSRTMNRVGHPKILFPRIHAYVPDYACGGSDSSLYLRGALDEVGEILKIAKGDSITGVLLKRELMEFMSGGEVIHLAMHAVAGDTAASPPYLLLNNIHDAAFADRLYNYEINSLMLSSPMVVLSSCETGGGQLQGGEGIMSLSRSFLLAGAASVIHTLWPVEDVKARQIMVDFYRELKRGKSKGQALSTAKKSYLAHSPPSYTHPYYWAGFQVTGNPEPLIMNPWLALVPLIILISCAMGYYLIRRNFLSRT